MYVMNIPFGYLAMENYILIGTSIGHGHGTRLLMSDLGINADGIPMLRFPKEPCGAYSPDLIQVVRLLIVAGIDQDLKSYEMWPLTQSMYINIFISI